MKQERRPKTAGATGEEAALSGSHVGPNTDRLRTQVPAGTSSSLPLAQTATPISFSTWCAYQSRPMDIVLLTLELVVTNWTNLVKVMYKIRCLPVAGSSHAAMQDAFPPPAHYATARADARIFSFPCGAPYPQQLLHAAASGALTDPWVRVRAGDYANLALIVTQLLAILVAVLLPRVYVRVRHWLLFTVNAVVPVGVAASVAWTPAALLSVGAPSYLGHGWSSIMVLYLAWKSVYVLRVPISYQQLFGPLLWLMLNVVMPAVQASLHPPPPASAADFPGGALEEASPPGTTTSTHQTQQSGRLTSLLQQVMLGPAMRTAVLSFLVIAVLPYVIARAWERAVLRPRYSSYVAAAAAAATGKTNRDGCRTHQAGGGGEAKTMDDKHPAGCGAQRTQAADNCSGGSPLGQQAGPSTVTPPAAADADGCSSGGNAPSAAGPLDGGGSFLSAPATASIASGAPGGEGSTRRGSSSNSSSLVGLAPSIADSQTVSTKPPASIAPTTGSSPTRPLLGEQQQAPEHSRQPAWKADTDASTLPRHQDSSTPPPHNLRPRRLSIDVDLLMPTALRSRASYLGTVAVGSSSRHVSSTGSGGSCSTLYGHLSPHQTQVLSVKVPLRHELGSGASRHSSFPAASARVVNAANAAVARHNAAAAAAAAAAAVGATSGAAGAGHPPGVAGSSLEGTLPRVVPLSCVCVEGCVHLLLLVQQHGGVGHRAAAADEDRVQQHAGMGSDTAGGAVVRHTTIGLGSSWGASGAEEEGGLEVDLDAAVQAAVLNMLGRSEADGSAGGCGGGLLGSGGATGLAAVWPSAVALWEDGGGGSAAGAAEGEGGAAEAGAAGDSVEVVVACSASLLRGLEAVRCVVTGQRRGGGAATEGTEQEQGQGRVYVDCAVPVAVERQRQLQGPVEPSDAGGIEEERVVKMRLRLPRTALLSPGVLTLHLLPPSRADSPSVLESQAASAPHPHAPLCFLPLLVLPAAAAREVAQLHAYAVAREMGWGEDGEQQLPQGTASGNAEDSEGSAAYAARISHLLAGTHDATAAEAAAAMAALLGNGMYSLSYDFAALLGMPYATARGSAPDPWVFCGVLRLLAERGMGACLRMGLGAMQRAGVRLRAGSGAASAAGAGAEDGAAWADDDGEVTVDAAERLLLGRAAAGRFLQGGPGAQTAGVAQDTNLTGGAGCTRAGDGQTAGAASPSSASAPREDKEAGTATAGSASAPREDKGAGTATAGSASAPREDKEAGTAAAGSAGARDAPASLSPSRQRLKQPPPEAAATAFDTTSAAAPAFSLFPCRCSAAPSSPAPPLPALPPSRGPSWRWWPRALLLGFQPAALEAAYQRYKAARCWSSDRLALLTHVGMATITLVRMLREDGGGAAGGGAGGGGYDPQLAAQVLWLGVNLGCVLLVALAPTYARHRNAVLLLRGLAGAAGLAAICWCVPATATRGQPSAATAGGTVGAGRSPGRPWLVLPVAWVLNCHKYNLHWLVFSLWEPAMLRLSVRYQAVVGAAYAPPAALLAFRLHRYGQQQQQPELLSATGNGTGAVPAQQWCGRSGLYARFGGWRTECAAMGAAAASAAAWHSAVVFAVGNAVCGLVISVVTDLAGRAAFVGQLMKRRGAAEGQRQRQQQQQAREGCEAED